MRFTNGLKDGLPIALGYVSVAFAYAISAMSAGFPAWFPVLVSFTNFTGTGQFAGELRADQRERKMDGGFWAAFGIGRADFGALVVGKRGDVERTGLQVALRVDDAVKTQAVPRQAARDVVRMLRVLAQQGQQVNLVR